MVLQPGEQEFTIGGGEFAFGKSRRYRITATGKMATFGGPGIAQVVCRVRRAGTENGWVKQSFPILVEDVTPLLPPSPANPPD
jgi:hypothetical protein